jgi:hypothetical protein
MMNEIETRKYEMLARVRDFGVRNAATFPAGTFAADLFGQIGATVAQLSVYSATKATGTATSREGTASRRLAVEALRDDLEVIARTARAIAIRQPNVAEKFRLPSSERAQALLDTARSFAAEAAPLRTEFARHEIGDAFFAKLEADIAAVEQALSVQRRGRDARVAARAAIESTVAAGMLAVRQLDSVVRNKVAADPAMLSAWASASRVQRTARPVRSSTPEPAGA